MRALLALALLSALAAAQTAKPKSKPAPKKAPVAAPMPEGTSWPLEALTVEGAKSWKPEAILAITGLKVGQMAGKPEFLKGQERLLATGYFESVAFQYAPGQGGAIRGSYQVAEVAQVIPWKIEDLPVTPAEFSSAAAAAEPLFGPEIPATPPVIERYVKILTALAAKKDFKDVITGKVTPLETPNDFVVLFRPRTQPPSVAEVSFTGMKIFEERDLQRAIGPVAVGSIYTESRFRQYLDASVRSLYETKGLLRVKFPSVTIAPSKGNKGLAVAVTVEEGEAYKLAAVDVRGSTLPKTQTEKMGDFHPNETVNYAEIVKGMDRIIKQIRDDGYLDAECKISRKVDDEAKTATFTVDVTPGPLYKFGTLTIQGLDIMTEPTIRKMYIQKTGDAFIASYPQHFLDRIRADQILDMLGETKAISTRNDKDRVVDVLLIFKGAKAPPRKREFN